MHSIISVDFLCDPSDCWVLDEFVALPLQTDSFLCFCPTVWIHPTTCRDLLPAHPKVATRRYIVGSYGQARETNKKNTESLTQNGHVRPGAKTKLKS